MNQDPLSGPNREDALTPVVKYIDFRWPDVNPQTMVLRLFGWRNLTE
jgi:hypothetical protein